MVGLAFQMPACWSGIDRTCRDAPWMRWSFKYCKRVNMCKAICWFCMERRLATSSPLKKRLPFWSGLAYWQIRLEDVLPLKTFFHQPNQTSMIQILSNIIWTVGELSLDPLWFDDACFSFGMLGWLYILSLILYYFITIHQRGQWRVMHWSAKFLISRNHGETLFFKKMNGMTAIQACITNYLWCKICIDHI